MTRPGDQADAAAHRRRGREQGDQPGDGADVAEDVLGAAVVRHRPRRPGAAPVLPRLPLLERLRDPVTALLGRLEQVGLVVGEAGPDLGAGGCETGSGVEVEAALVVDVVPEVVERLRALGGRRPVLAQVGEPLRRLGVVGAGPPGARLELAGQPPRQVAQRLHGCFHRRGVRLPDVLARAAVDRGHGAVDPAVVALVPRRREGLLHEPLAVGVGHRLLVPVGVRGVHRDVERLCLPRVRPRDLEVAGLVAPPVLEVAVLLAVEQVGAGLVALQLADAVDDLREEGVQLLDESAHLTPPERWARGRARGRRRTAGAGRTTPRRPRRRPRSRRRSRRAPSRCR